MNNSINNRIMGTIKYLFLISQPDYFEHNTVVSMYILETAANYRYLMLPFPVYRHSTTNSGCTIGGASRD